jgi:ABC-type transport system involved in multi-copper enzyme maturation permease subunit
MLGGPMLLFDAVRTARGARLALFRSLYALVLLLVLFLVYTSWFGHDIVDGLVGIMDARSMPPRLQARFAASFFHSFLVVQLAAALLLTPVFTANAVAEERQKGTLPLLLTTALEEHEVLLGKLFSRLGHIVLLLLAGVPILALLQLFGGVDPALLVAESVITLAAVLSTASISLYCSSGAHSGRAAVFQAYGVAYLAQIGVSLVWWTFASILPRSWEDPILATSPSLMFAYMTLEGVSSTGRLDQWLPWLLFGQTVGHGLLAGVFLLAAVRRLRRTPAHTPDTRSADDLRDPLLPCPRVLPPVTDHPLVWKECHVDGGLLRGNCATYLSSILFVFGLALVIHFIFIGWALTGLEHGLYRQEFVLAHGSILLPLLVVAAILRLGLCGAATLAGERDRQTLDCLLTTDLTNDEILGEKWLGCWYSQRRLLLILGLLILCGIVIRSVPLETLPLLLLSTGVWLAFALCLGMYCSLVCGSAGRSMVLTLFGLLAVGAGHWIVFLLARALGLLWHWPASLILPLEALHTYGFSPPLTLAALASGKPLDGLPLFGVVAGTFVYALLAVVLWWRVLVRFGTLAGRQG